MRAELQNMNPKGSIINASSVAGVAGFPKNAAYTAAKHGVIGLSRTAAKEVIYTLHLFFTFYEASMVDLNFEQEKAEFRLSAYTNSINSVRSV
jgi:NADP-dependent 3-hydroxy acid dehydrogenase YdfG